MRSSKTCRREAVSPRLRMTHIMRIKICIKHVIRCHSVNTPSTEQYASWLSGNLGDSDISGVMYWHSVSRNWSRCSASCSTAPGQNRRMGFILYAFNGKVFSTPNCLFLGNLWVDAVEPGLARPARSRAQNTCTWTHKHKPAYAPLVLLYPRLQWEKPLFNHFIRSFAWQIRLRLFPLPLAALT